MKWCDIGGVLINEESNVIIYCLLTGSVEAKMSTSSVKSPENSALKLK